MLFALLKIILNIRPKKKSLREPKAGGTSPPPQAAPHGSLWAPGPLPLSPRHAHAGCSLLLSERLSLHVLIENDHLLLLFSI